MPILQYLDIAIGYAFAMLLLATLTGAVVEAAQLVYRSRKRALEAGLTGLVESLGLAKPAAEGIARDILEKSAARGPGLAAEAIQREEFILLLLQKATTPPPSTELANAIQALSGKAPATLLADIEKLTVEMEAAEPSASSYLWRVKAIEKAGAGAFGGRVFSWYDNMTRRVDDYVNFQGRLVGAVAAALVCFWLVPVDSFDLLGRLGRDDNFRKMLVERAIEEVKKGPTTPAQDAPKPNEPPKSPPDDAKGGASVPSRPAKEERVEQLLDELEKKADATRSLLAPAPNPQNVGLAITWIMVCLGSPFWWGLLKRLVGLKSSLGEKLDAQRLLREGDQRTPTVRS